MHSGKGHIDETYIHSDRAARLLCNPNLIPAPGQYLLAHAATTPDAPLPHPIFKAASHAAGFYTAHPLPPTWTPGTLLTLRGPLGHGFTLPPAARHIALVAFGNTCSRLLALLEPALAQNAAVTLLTSAPPSGLSPTLEILPLASLSKLLSWADYLAIDLPRAALQAVFTQYPALIHNDYATDFLVETPLPCGGMADCGACAIRTKNTTRLACRNGPVFPAQAFLK
jgi:dihydroorotate dehydrogenase electron transfer subunit